eukprot:CAMPEP_0204197100 /NCGR_PEP_ID=MMETSP0361-20130328/64318_1 /ASSEMBLY_ACC=CAM_ASM_000343 /TAXON_ID=268821 /ORGANISM="Scrippsiella Hangoei, Strain SHTV-5" /LENGTH=212 /DNA_ID=CAMNT_0051158971 /DNA_START=31 /DNA_END=665 /DNA_ORIENTATION=+
MSPTMSPPNGQLRLCSRKTFLDVEEESCEEMSAGRLRSASAPAPAATCSFEGFDAADDADRRGYLEVLAERWAILEMRCGRPISAFRGGRNQRRCGDARLQAHKTVDNKDEGARTPNFSGAASTRAEEESQQSDAAAVGDAGAGFPSIGSRGHYQGSCKPCSFHLRGAGCLNAAACHFCHVSHGSTTRKAPKSGAKRRELKMQKRRDEASAA